MATLVVIGFIAISVKLIRAMKMMPQGWWKIWKYYDKEWWSKPRLGFLRETAPQEPEQSPLLDGP